MVYPPAGSADAELGGVQRLELGGLLQQDRLDATAATAA